MTAALPIHAAPALEGWRAHLAALAGAAAAFLLLFHRDALDMASIWWRSPTFNHCLLVLPLIFWLVWQRRPELARLAPRAWAPGLGVVAAGGAAWLLGEAGGVALIRHASLVLMLEGAVAACLGPAIVRALGFPLLYAAFLVPAGEELVPPLQTLTAEMSMGLLALFGVPAHIEGIFITTPSGLFRVAEACSGVRFLVAMAAYGALVANVCFTRPSRRAAFIAASLVVPILANGLRAWGTIYVAHLTDNKVAVGFDHIVYGWVFFAIVIGALMATAWPFFDRRPGDPWFDPERLQPAGTAAGSPRAAIRTAAGVVALAALPLLWSAGIAASGRASLPASPAFPEVPGWTRVARDSGWEPHFAGADRLALARYRDSAGREVDLVFAVFARQEEGRELVGYGQGAAAPDGPWSWTADSPAPPGGHGERIAAPGRVREVVTFYRVGDALTGSPAAVKLETMKVRLLGGPQRAVAVLVSAEGGRARDSIGRFLAAAGPVAPLADRAAGLQGPR